MGKITLIKMSYRKAVSRNTISNAVKEAQYAVRGKIPARAQQIRADLVNGVGSYPFEEVNFLNIGNPQFFRQPPITFFREVLAATLAPSLLKDSSSLNKDVRNRAEYYLEHYISMGSYSDSCGALEVCKNLARYISERDGYPCDPSDVMTCDGASQGIAIVMNLIAQNEKTGFMVPLPQYPLYSAQTRLINGQFVGYY